MPTSPAVPPTAAAVEISSDSEDYEYEEVEIEEEIEVEEEVSDDEEEEGDGEDLWRSIEDRDDELSVSEGTTSNLPITAETDITCSSEIKPTSQEEDPATNSSFNEMDKDNLPVNAVNLLHDQSVTLAGETTMISNDEESPQWDGAIMTAETTKSVHESSKQVTASDKVPHSEEQTTQVNTKDANDVQQKEPRLDVDVPLIRPRRLSPAMETKEGNKHPALMWKATIISNDEKSPQCDGGIMTAETTNPVNESSKEVNASDKVPHSEEQTTQVNAKDVSDAQQTGSRLGFDVPLIKRRSLSPAMEVNKANKHPAVMCVSSANGRCNRGTSCKFLHINDTTNSRSKKRKADTSLVCPDKLTPDKLTDAKNSSKKRKKRSKDKKLLISDSGLSGAGTDPWTTNEICHHHTVPAGEIGSRMHVSDRAGCLMVQAMGSVSELINCYNQKVDTEERLREENLKNAKRLKKLKSSVRFMSEKVKEAVSMVAEKEAEVGDLMEKLERAYKENDELQRENARLQGKTNPVGELDRP